MKILLVCPANPKDVDRQILKELSFLGDEAFFAPHACAVVAALTPDEHEVRIHDEAIHGPVDAVLGRETFDVVGMSLIANAYVRAIEIASCFRRSEQPGLLVAGGACMLHMLSALRELVDVAFVGEAEETWPRFLRELAEGRQAPLYRQIAKPDLSSMPVPRWELIRRDLPRYTVAAVQTVRGCPHDCSFCDVIYTFGRKLRVKPVDQVLEEIRLLESLGVEMIFFADDNFAANRRHTKAILRRLVEVNNTFKSRLSFATQVDITIADDEELLQLLLDANFVNLQIGIESVSEASLTSLHKQHNLELDIAEAVRTIQSYGIVVMAHMIFGTDADELGVFEASERFLDDAHVVHQASHPLMAPPGTKLWYQLQQQGRLVTVSPDMQDRLDLYTNVVPKQMSRIELIEGLAAYRLRVSEPDRFFDRVRGFADGVTHRTSYEVKNSPPLWRNLKRMFSMIWHYMFFAHRSERHIFFRLLKETGTERSFLVPTVFYAFVCHAMERRQAEIKATWAAEIVEQERLMPGGPPVMSRSVAIAPAIRDSFLPIATAAYHRVRRETGDREILYQVVVEALQDFALRFGDTFDSFDDYHRDAVYKSCDRVMNGRRPVADSGRRSLPEDDPPAGFARDILDALDQTVRFGLHTSIQ